jgi:hypothetical protein
MNSFECKWWGMVLVPAIVLGFGGCASEAGLSVVSSVPPPAVSVTRTQAWKDAEALAAMDPRRMTVIGSGDSMRPVYGENTVLVLQKIPYESLTAGMNVAYRKSSGIIVLHRLVERVGGGWRVVGLNNEEEDAERVMPENLLGIVYAAFANDSVK